MIAFLLVLAAVLYAVEKYSLEHAFDKLEFRTAADKGLVEPSETFTWTMAVSNGKRQMVPYLQVKELIPEGLIFSDSKEPVEEEGQSGLVSVFYVSGRQKLEQKRQVAFTGRGRYFFRGVVAEAGDFLGLKGIRESFPELEEVVVKPRPCESIKLLQLLGGYLGEFSSKRSLLEDPILIRGFREYTGREPFRAISWSQSARHDKLLVKEYEQTADLSCTVLLNVWWEERENRGEILETCFSMTRSVCEELEKKKIPYDFRTNGIIAGAIGSWRRVEEGLGPGHLEAVLEGLGRMTYESRESEEEFFSGILRSVRAGRAVILVTPKRGQNADRAKEALEERTGQKVLMVTPKEVEE